MSFDAPYLTDLGEVYVEGGNSQIFEADNGQVLLMNMHPVFYNEVRVDIVDAVYEFIKYCFHSK